ncbi:MAG: ABC transporter ATP-binding protein [Chloroflexota bacterium]
MPPLLEIKDLATYFYTMEGTVKAVDGISYDLQAGETLGLVGESGCGKSVSALSVMGLIPWPPGKVVGGEILFNGEDLRKYDAAAMRRVRGKEITMVFQEPMTCLNPVLTIERQITETMELHLGMDRQTAVKRALELIQMVGIPDAERRIKQYPHQFSGGMRQRVMIAMALSCNPKLIFADEPTTALDVTIQAQILELMQSLCKQFGTALIIITHNLGVVARYSDRVNVMYAGKLIERGTSRDIYNRPKHPYTLGLLHSVPRLDEPRRVKLDPIEGQPPSLVDLPPGCFFQPRCRFAAEKCAAEYPPLREVEGPHLAACWEWEKVEGLARARA